MCSVMLLLDSNIANEIISHFAHLSALLDAEVPQIAAGVECRVMCRTITD